MKKVTMSMAKSAAVMFGGTAVTVVASAKVTDAVYNATNDYNLACSAGAGAAVVGIGATSVATIAIIDHDVKDWTAQDHEDARKLRNGLNTVTDGMDLVSKAMKVASFFSR